MCIFASFCAFSAANYTLVAPKKAVVGKIFTTLLTVNYDAPKDVTIELLPLNSKTVSISKTTSLTGSGK